MYLYNIISKSFSFVLQILYNNIQHCQTIKILNKKILPLQSEINYLKNHVRKCKFQVPIHKKLLINDSKPFLYTGLITYELFTKLHNFSAPLVRRRYHGYKNLLKWVSKLKISFINSPKKWDQKESRKKRTKFLWI